MVCVKALLIRALAWCYRISDIGTFVSCVLIVLAVLLRSCELEIALQEPPRASD